MAGDSFAREAVAFLNDIDPSLQISFLTGVFCYFILRGGKAKDEAPLIIMLYIISISSFAHLIFKSILLFSPDIYFVDVAIPIQPNQAFIEKVVERHYDTWLLYLVSFIEFLIMIFICSVIRYYRGIENIFKFLRKRGFLDIAPYGDALIEIKEQTKDKILGCRIVLKSGCVFYCDLKPYEKAPISQITIDDEGNISCYVTKKTKKDAIFDEDSYENVTTYIPKNNIFIRTYIRNSEIESLQFLFIE